MNQSNSVQYPDRKKHSERLNYSGKSIKPCEYRLFFEHTYSEILIRATSNQPNHLIIRFSLKSAFRFKSQTMQTKPIKKIGSEFQAPSAVFL